DPSRAGRRGPERVAERRLRSVDVPRRRRARNGRPKDWSLERGRSDRHPSQPARLADVLTRTRRRDRHGGGGTQPSAPQARERTAQRRTRPEGLRRARSGRARTATATQQCLPAVTPDSGGPIRTRPPLRLGGPDRRALSHSREGVGSSALRPSRASCPSPNDSVRLLQTSAWRPAWLQGGLTIGATSGRVKYPSQVISSIGGSLGFREKHALFGGCPRGHLAVW